MRRRIVGPVALITIGVLGLLDEFTRLDWDKTWPLILIAIGTALFVQRAARAGEPTPRGGPSPAAPDSNRETDSEKKVNRE